MKRALKCYLCICFCLIFIFTSCNNTTKSLTQKQYAGVKDSVQQMVELIARDVSQDGPIAWLRYFENTPGFFMANNGLLVFPNNDSATVFIKNIVVKQIRKIELQWSNTRIDPLTPRFASFAANWHENITDFSGNATSYSGYFTGIAEKTSSGWQLRNAHWSVSK
jgi:hypothetical protein